jgi:hypothetical protein
MHAPGAVRLSALAMDGADLDGEPTVLDLAG